MGLPGQGAHGAGGRWASLAPLPGPAGPRCWGGRVSWDPRQALLNVIFASRLIAGWGWDGGVRWKHLYQGGRRPLERERDSPSPSERPGRHLSIKPVWVLFCWWAFLVNTGETRHSTPSPPA